MYCGIGPRPSPMAGSRVAGRGWPAKEQAGGGEPDSVGHRRLSAQTPCLASSRIASCSTTLSLAQESTSTALSKELCLFVLLPANNRPRASLQLSNSARAFAFPTSDVDLSPPRPSDPTPLPPAPSFPMGFLHEARVFFWGEPKKTAAERRLIIKIDCFVRPPSPFRHPASLLVTPELA